MSSSKQLTHRTLGSWFLLYVLVLLYVLFANFCLIFTYTYILYDHSFIFVITWNIENFLIFQIYVLCDLNIQTCNIYKYSNYNRNLRVDIFWQISSACRDVRRAICIWNASIVLQPHIGATDGDRCCINDNNCATVLSLQPPYETVIQR